MKTKFKLAGLGVIASFVLSGVVAPAAQATDYKTCYLTMPAKWSITSYASADENRAIYENWTDYLSGDCPSTTELAVDWNPEYWGSDYTTGGVQHGYSGMTFLENIDGNPFYVYNTDVDDTYRWELGDVWTGVDADGNDTRSVVMRNYAVNGNYQDQGRVWTGATDLWTSVWTGNNATDDCNYDAVDCIGGWTYDNYRFVTVNSLTWKYASPFTAKVKKSGSSLKFNVSLDRGAVMDEYNDAGEKTFAFGEDRVKVYRSGKLIKSKSFTKLGKASITVRDKSGKQKYKVCIPEISRAWAKCKSYTR